MNKWVLSNPAPGEDLLSGNLVMETGCKKQESLQNIVDLYVDVNVCVCAWACVYAYACVCTQAYEASLALFDKHSASLPAIGGCDEGTALGHSKDKELRNVKRADYKYKYDYR